MRYKNKPNSYVYLDTPCGRLRGLRKGGCLEFKGIRFARAGRWEEPQRIEHWDGVYDATRPGPQCCQHLQFYSRYQDPFNAFYYEQNAEKRVFEYSEEYGLNLNIWAPEGAKDLPVAVFIHGGSFCTGGNMAVNICNGGDYCKRGVILVNINYRLNAFAVGYDETHTGNYALKDQIAALTWVKYNIAAFGGDPKRVTIMGESAGALSVQLLLYAPQARGLFCGAVMMSGGGDFESLGTPAEGKYTQEIWRLVRKHFAAQSLDELKDRPAKEIYDAWTQAAATTPQLAAVCAAPIIDGTWIPDRPAALKEAGAVADVPCIIGLSSQDVIPYQLYRLAVEWADYHRDTGRSPVYGYYMDRQLPGDGAGAYHGCDLWYAFGTLDQNWRPFEEADYKLSENMIDYFAAFIRTGVPQPEGLPEWKPMTEQPGVFLRFGEGAPELYRPPADALAADIRNTDNHFINTQ